VDALLANAGLTLKASERETLISGLNAGTLTRADVLLQIGASPAAAHSETGAAGAEGGGRANG
jgi:hypothetical protein